MLRWTLAVLLFSTITLPASAQSRGDWYWGSPEPRGFGPRYRDAAPDYRVRDYFYERRRWLDEEEPPRYWSDSDRRRRADEDPALEITIAALARPGFIGISVGPCDENAWFEPQRVVYIKDKPV